MPAIASAGADDAPAQQNLRYVPAQVLTLEVIPVLYTIWRHRQLERAQRLGVPLEVVVRAAPAWAQPDQATDAPGVAARSAEEAAG